MLMVKGKLIKEYEAAVAAGISSVAELDIHQLTGYYLKSYPGKESVYLMRDMREHVVSEYNGRCVRSILKLVV